LRISARIRLIAHDHHQVLPRINFELRNHDHALSQRRLDLLEELIHFHQRPVVILSRTHPALPLAPDRHLAETDEKTEDVTLSLEKKWTQLLLTFYWIDVDRLFPASAAEQGSASIGVSEVVSEKGGESWLRQMVKRWVAQQAARQIAEESSRDQALSLSWKELTSMADGTEPDQLRREYDDRVAIYYHRFWSSCTRNEKLVLR
jgi:hypothetical protein